ncbi:hypothetical protein RhiirA1_453781, partial [Rhizophagus irregularis]
MGITPSRERFVALEGYATKSDEERTEIITNAGLEITEQDATIAKFLGLDNPIFGSFIRGIIMICIDENNNARNREFDAHIEEYKRMSNEMLNEKQLEMNEIVMKMTENWKKKEAYYFGNTNEKKHLIRTEHGTIDIEDKEKMKTYGNMSEKKFLEKIRQENEDNVLSDFTPSTPSDTSENEEIEQVFKNRHNKMSHQTLGNTYQNTNKIIRMHDQNKYGKFDDPLNQSLTMAITEDHTMGQVAKKSKESIHRPKGEGDLKFFVGMLSINIKSQDEEKSLVNWLNENKYLEYHVNTLGKTIYNGNGYTYVGFFTEAARNNFLQNDTIKQEVGAFRPLEWLDRLNKTITLL